MAELSYNLKRMIDYLSNNICHYYPSNTVDDNNFSASISNHNVFSKFFIIDCDWGKGVIPTLFSDMVMSALIDSDVKRNIRNLHCGGISGSNHRGLTSILSFIHKNPHVVNNCVKHITNKGETYYTLGNILFDKDFNPLMIPCYEVETLEDGMWKVNKVIFKFSTSLFSSENDDIKMAKKFIISKMVPYLAEKSTFIECRTGGVSAYQYDLPIKIEFEDLSGFVCSPMEPSENFNVEANAILDALVEDILATNE